MTATLSQDTHPYAERVQVELLRRASVWYKLYLGIQMPTTVRGESNTEINP